MSFNYLGGVAPLFGDKVFGVAFNGETIVGTVTEAYPKMSGYIFAVAYAVDSGKKFDGESIYEATIAHGNPRDFTLIHRPLSEGNTINSSVPSDGRIYARFGGVQ